MTAPHDRPTAIELLEAVREWMEKDLLPGVEGRLQFHARVAINMVEIVAREIELGVVQEHDHRAVIASLGKANDDDLVAAIKNGEYDARLTSLLETLRPVIEDKVRVANPKYLR